MLHCPVVFGAFAAIVNGIDCLWSKGQRTEPGCLCFRIPFVPPGVERSNVRPRLWSQPERRRLLVLSLFPESGSPIIGIEMRIGDYRLAGVPNLVYLAVAAYFANTNGLGHVLVRVMDGNQSRRER